MNKALLSFLFLAIFLISAPSAATVAISNSDKVCLLDNRGESHDMLPCLVASMPCGDLTTNHASYYGVRLNKGDSLTPIDVHGKCRYLDSSSDNGYFVPFKSPTEWTSFINNLPPGVTAKPCARYFEKNIHVGNKLYFGPTSIKQNMGDKGDLYAPVELPYWRTGRTWPDNPKCTQTYTFKNLSCYEHVVQSHCWNYVEKTCQRCVQKDKNNVCTKTEDYDCSYCADMGSVCAEKWHSWEETFSFLATALDSDEKNPSWKGQSTRLSNVTRPAACDIRCTFDKHDCRCPPPPGTGGPGTGGPGTGGSGTGGSGTGNSGSGNSNSGNNNGGKPCAYGLADGQTSTQSCPCPYGSQSCPGPTMWGFTVYSCSGRFDSHTEGCTGTATVKCENGTLRLVSSNCQAIHTGH